MRVFGNITTVKSSIYIIETPENIHSGLAIYILKSIVGQKKTYGNSNISPCKNKPNLLKKSSKKKPKSFKILL